MLFKEKPLDKWTFVDFVEQLLHISGEEDYDEEKVTGDWATTSTVHAGKPSRGKC